MLAPLCGFMTVLEMGMVSDLSDWVLISMYLSLYLSFTVRTKYKHAGPSLIKRTREIEVHQ